jgi:NAD(P)-dependent dehydrogenase (short-subunit alcohol dehydrogenase family)
MNQKRKGQVAVVTGAGGTLCSEMAKALALRGLKVALIGRDVEKLSVVEKEIESRGGVALSVSADVADEQMVHDAHDRIFREFGRCTVLINGAGGNQPDAITTINEFDELELEDNVRNFRGFFNLSMERFQSVIEVNTMGTVIPSFIFGKEMARHKQGCIVNIASMNSYRPLSRVAAYGMAKAGIANFTQWLSAYLAPANIRVNAIAPGFFLNDRSRKLLLTSEGYSERGRNIINHTPMRRFGEANELIGCMNWLIDDEAAGFVTGTVIPVDGGFISCSGV